MSERDPVILLRRLAETTGKGQMRFSVCQGGGWITTNSEEAVRALCDVWNNREAIAHAHLKEPAP